MMHEQFLLAALEQAKLGRGFCAPNPSVGAVAVRQEKIIAQSWHRGAGTPHAEQLLLEQLQGELHDVTLYVTLEPCNHWGRTPPCVEAIIQRGIKKVVYAYADPNPVVSGRNTPGLLNDHGVENLHYPIDSIDAFYQSYHYWTQNKRPWLTVKMAQSLDGKIAGPGGERVDISNAACAEFTHQQRRQTDIILTTARTINQDNPMLNVRLGQCTLSKPVAILEGREKLNKDALVLQAATSCLVYNDAAEINENTSYQRYAVPSQQGLLDLEVVLKHLGQLGYHDVWVEAGARLFHALHQAKRVNRTYIYVAPKCLGEMAKPLFSSASMFSQAAKISWQVMADNAMLILDW
jgi:diaminohydroxyphosphoribosylaminopyrimidine deaminase/5-amino-6-(5-phosphoribosylamino)uracil reductase